MQAKQFKRVPIDVERSNKKMENESKRTKEKKQKSCVYVTKENKDKGGEWRNDNTPNRKRIHDKQAKRKEITKSVTKLKCVTKYFDPEHTTVCSKTE